MFVVAQKDQEVYPVWSFEALSVDHDRGGEDRVEAEAEEEGSSHDSFDPGELQLVSNSQTLLVNPRSRQDRDFSSSLDERCQVVLKVWRGQKSVRTGFFVLYPKKGQLVGVDLVLVVDRLLGH